MNPVILAVLNIVMPVLVWFTSAILPRWIRHARRVEARNKLIVMSAVHVGETIVRRAASRHLAELVETCRAVDSHRSLWALEGLGHQWGLCRLEQAWQPHRMLSFHDAPIPHNALAMLHAGLCLVPAKSLNTISVKITGGCSCTKAWIVSHPY